MNERIQELEAQCWKTVPCDFDMQQGGLSTIQTVFDREKFAEMIVRECCGIFVDLRTRPADLAVLDVNKHFGVAE